MTIRLNNLIQQLTVQDIRSCPQTEREAVLVSALLEAELNAEDEVNDLRSAWDTAIAEKDLEIESLQEQLADSNRELVKAQNSLLWNHGEKESE